MTDGRRAAATERGRVAATRLPESARRCPYCDRAFATDDRLRLHKGIDHADDLDDEERAAYERAATAEAATLRRLKLAALLVLVGVYFGFLFVYAIVAFS